MPVPYKDGLPKWKRPGVYGIVNTVNGKVYVGSSLSVRGRLSGHRCELRKGTHGNRHLQASWNKYGEESFRFDLLEICEPELVIAKEQYWLDKLQSYDRTLGYNTRVEASSNAGLKCSDETRAKMSEAQKGKDMSKCIAAAAEARTGNPRPLRVRAKISASQKGRPGNRKGATLSQETRRRISLSKKGKPSNRKGAVCSEESRRRMSASQLARAARNREEKEKINEI